MFAQVPDEQLPRLWGDVRDLGPCLWCHPRRFDYARAASEGAVLIVATLYLRSELKELKALGFATYFSDAGNGAHMLNIFLFYINAVLVIIAHASVPDADPTVDYTNRWIDLRTPAHYFEIARDVNSFNMFLSWIKCFASVT